MTDTDLLRDLEAIVGADYVLREAEDNERYTRDWPGRYSGQAAAVVRPGSVDEVSTIMALASKRHIGVVPQSGNTSLCGGGIPDQSGDNIVLSLNRLNRIRDIQIDARVATVESGVILQQLQDALADHRLMFPLDFGAKGSCMIGGNLSTNAGGSNVLRYGNTRDLCLGLEVVMPDGRIMNLLTSLHKDNTGYDLKDLFIGAEGTLGIITAATLTLVPLPAVRHTAFLSVASPNAALQVLNRVQDDCADLVDAFEIMTRESVDVICRYCEGVNPPFDEPVDYAVLVQVASATPDDTLGERFEQTLATLYENGIVLDAVIASSETQRAAMWKLRESALEGNVGAGPAVRADISFPLDQIQTFADSMERELASIAPQAIPRYIGHLGDGNLHYAIALGPDRYWDDALAEQVEQRLLSTVVACRGSISAEHGIGSTKVEQLAQFKDPVALQVMQSIKHALDPLGIMNPGKMLRSSPAG
jgi:FAD/FMN-containing dehydrogenase